MAELEKAKNDSLRQVKQLEVELANCKVCACACVYLSVLVKLLGQSLGQFCQLQGKVSREVREGGDRKGGGCGDMIRLCTAMPLLTPPIRTPPSSVPYHNNPPRRSALQANSAKKDAEIVELQKKLEAAAAELLAAQAALTEAYAERDAARLECSKLQAALNRYILNVLVYTNHSSNFHVGLPCSHILCCGVEYVAAFMYDCQCISIYLRANDEVAKLEAAVLNAKSNTPSDEDVG